MDKLTAFKRLLQLKQELGVNHFTIADLRKVFPEHQKYMHIYAHRLTKAGILQQVYKGVYVLADQPYDVKKLACQIYYPSYVSLQTALSIYGVINQGTYDVTLVTTRRTKQINVNGVTLRYFRIKPHLFFGYSVDNSTATAVLEKAILDTLYFVVFGKLHIDLTEWDPYVLKDVKKARLREFLRQYSTPARARLQKKLAQLKLV